MSATKQDIYVANEAERISTILGSAIKELQQAVSGGQYKGSYYETSFPNKCKDLQSKLETVKANWDNHLGVYKRQVSNPLMSPADRKKYGL